LDENVEERGQYRVKMFGKLKSIKRASVESAQLVEGDKSNLRGA